MRALGNLRFGILGALAAAVVPAFAQAPLTANQAVITGLLNRPSVLAAKEKLKSALANQSALSAYLPTRAEFGGSTRPDLGVGNDLLLAQPIDISGKTRASRDTGKAGVILAQSQLRQTQLDLQTEILNAYADALSAQDLVETGKALAAMAQQSFDATKARIASGDLPPNELLRANLELERAKQALTQREHALDSARVRLASSMGVAQVGDLGDFVAIPVGNPGLIKRPDLTQIKSDIATAHADSEAARASSWPDLELQLGRTYWDMPGQYVARLQFVWNFLDFGASREKAKQAQADRKSAEATYQDRLATAAKEIEAARIDFVSARESYQGYAPLTEDAKSLLAKEEGAFAAGASTLLDVLDASRAVRDVEESASAAKTQWIQSEAKYLAATGALLTEVPR